MAAAAVAVTMGVLGSAPADATTQATCGSPRTLASSPRALTTTARGTFFTADDGRHGRELWRSDGTRAGTVLVEDVRPGRGGSNPTALRAVGNTLFFTADDGVHGRELWRSDGTRTGTVLVKDIRAGAAGSDPSSLTSDGRTLFFDADDGDHGAELWKTDGTRTGTVLVKDVRPGARGSHRNTYGYTRKMTQAAGRLFFEADDGAHGDELWTSDGTAGGTVLVSDLRPGAGDALGLFLRRPMAGVGPVLFFSADDGTHGTQLWKTTGTTTGTVRLTDFAQDYYFGNVPAQLTDVAGTLFFTAQQTGSHGAEGADDLWRSDGTRAGTVRVKQLTSYSYPSSLTAVGGTLFFAAEDGEHGAELWRSNGTAAGTVMVKDIAPSTGYPVSSSSPDHLTDTGGRVFFAASDDVHGRELWRSDGSRAGTVLVEDVRPGPGDSNPSSLAAAGRTLSFSADDGKHGAELWTSDGTRAGTVLVRDINTGRSCTATPEATGPSTGPPADGAAPVQSRPVPAELGDRYVRGRPGALDPAAARALLG